MYIIRSLLIIKKDSNKANRSEGEDTSFIKPEVPGIFEKQIKPEDRFLEYIRNLQGKNW